MDHTTLVHSAKSDRTGVASGRSVHGRRDEHSLRCTDTHRPNHRDAAVLVSLLAMGSMFAVRVVAQDQQFHQRPSSIRGTVINGLTHEPISRALVYTADNRFATWSDSDGHFEYPLPKAIVGDPGNYPQFTFCCVQARKPGFLSDPDQQQGVEMTLGSEPTISLIPEGLIKGRVSLPSSDAAFGIDIDLFSRQVQNGTFRWVTSLTVRANSKGEFRFAELLPGEYKLVTHELMDTDPSALLPGRPPYGFPPVYFPGALDLTSASPIQLKVGQTLEADLLLVRQPYYQVRIPVADDVENAAIKVSVQGHDSPGYSLGYNPERRRIEGLLPNGTYLVSTETFGPNAATGTVSITVSGAAVEGPKMALSPHSSVRLNVNDDFLTKEWNQTTTWSDGKHTFELHGPRLYFQASLDPVGDLDLQGGRSIRPPTKPDDALVIEDVAPGRYWLRLSSARGYAASATAGGVDLLHEPLAVSAGSTSTVDITLRDDFAEIEGALTNLSTVPDAAAKPGYSGYWRPSAYIYFVPQPEGTGQYQQIAADAEGKFNAQNIAPGNYLVLAFKKPMNLPYDDLEAMRIYEPKGQKIQLAAGQKEKLELQVISSSE
jgi:hypothetical protein